MNELRVYMETAMEYLAMALRAPDEAARQRLLGGALRWIRLAAKVHWRHVGHGGFRSETSKLH